MILHWLLLSVLKVLTKLNKVLQLITLLILKCVLFCYMNIVARSFDVAPFKVPTIKQMFNSQRTCQSPELVPVTKSLIHTGAKSLTEIWELPYGMVITRKVMKEFHSAGKNAQSTFWPVELTGKSLDGRASNH